MLTAEEGKPLKTNQNLQAVTYFPTGAVVLTLSCLTGLDDPDLELDDLEGDL
jgi:hypothetical protein